MILLSNINETTKITENGNVPTDLDIPQSKHDNIKKEVEVLVSNKAGLDPNVETTGDVYDLDSFFNMIG